MHLHLWVGLLAGSLAIGACLAGTLVAPQRSQLIAFTGMILGGWLAVVSFSALADAGATAVGLAIFFSLAGSAGGYWIAAAVLSHSFTTTYRRPEQSALNAPSGPAVVLLANAAPPRYGIASVAHAIERLVSSRALILPTSALPFLFLSERVRYKAMGGYNPARATVAALADQLAKDLAHRVAAVETAWCDGSPDLAQVVRSLADRDCASVVLLSIGPDGSYVMRDAEHDAADITEVRIVHAPSIWRSDLLSERLAERVLQSTRGAELESVGVVLTGEGEPAAWSAVAGEWGERENYFNQRVRLMLVERGILEEHIRLCWLEWQTPDVTETVRHLAALGCRRIVVAPSTLPHTTLASALDLPRAITSARLEEEVTVVTLTPWGDDPAISRASAEAIERALDRLEA